MPLWCGVWGFRGGLCKKVLEEVRIMATSGAFRRGRRGPGIGGLGGGRGFQKGEERTPNMLSAAGALLPLDLGARLPAASPLPCGGWGAPTG